MINNKINSLAIYGSKARNDYDSYSDNDLLIVSDSFNNTFEIEQSYNKRGFSCSAYTFNKLEILSKRKALFIQHLKQDAKIISDKDNRLQNLLDCYSPKENYLKELNEAISYFKILEFIPNSNEGIGWAFDIIAIGLRNYNILELANHKVYEFSLPAILRQSQRIFNLSEEEIEQLVNIRIYKKLYREKKYDLLPLKVELLKVISIIEKKYHISIPVNFLSYDLFNHYSFTKMYSKNTLSAYQKLRLFEAFVMTSPVISNTTVKEKCRRIIESPKFYANDFKSQEFINDLLIELTSK